MQDGPAVRYGRRALMLGAAAVGVGITAGLIASAAPAEAANDDPILLGESNTATSTTEINTTSGDGLQANTTGDSGSHGVLGTATFGTGVAGISTYGTGVHGETLGSGGYGVYGQDASRGGATGVVGRSTEGDGVFGISTYGNGVAAVGPSGVWAVGLGTGYGVQATDTAGELSTPVFAQVVNIRNGSPAVNAWSSGKGSAVVATIDNTKNSSPALSATTNGTGPAVLASHPDGTALQVEGIASFSRSGRATVAGTPSAPRQSVVVTGVVLSSSSLILVTPQDHVTGVAVEGVVADITAKTFTIYLTKPVTVSLAIAWFVLG